MNKKEPKRKLNNLEKGAIVFSCFFLFGVLLTLFFVYVWSKKPTFVGVMDAMQISGIIIFTIYFFIVLSNQNVFTIFTFGFKKFWSRIIKGSNDNLPPDLFTYNQQRKKVPYWSYFSIYLASLCFLIPGLIMLIIWGVA